MKISRANWVLAAGKVGAVNECGKREAATPRWNLSVGAVTLDSTSKHSYYSKGSAMITCREKDLSDSGYCLCISNYLDIPGKSQFGELEPVIHSVYSQFTISVVFFYKLMHKMQRSTQKLIANVILY